jgi:hypothetical protein
MWGIEREGLAKVHVPKDGLRARGGEGRGVTGGKMRVGSPTTHQTAC